MLKSLLALLECASDLGGLAVAGRGGHLGGELCLERAL